MNYLALDTSSDALSIALAQDGSEGVDIIAAYHQPADKQHGVALVPTLAKLMEEVGWTPASIDSIVVGLGPGSYTGLRIGVTLAKMWGGTMPVTIKGVSSLALLAHQALGQADWIIPIVDARRLSCYTNIYYQGDKGFGAIGPDCHTDWAPFQTTLADFFRDKPDATVVFIGKEITPFVEVFRENHPQVRFQVMDRDSLYPDARHAFLGVAWEGVEDIAVLAPNYAHATLAEQKWAAKQTGSQVEEGDHDRYIQDFS